MTDRFDAADAKTLAEALYVRSIVRTGAATPDALHELQERCVKSALAFAEAYNADLPLLCPSAVEAKNIDAGTRRIFGRQDDAEDKAARRLIGVMEDARKRIAQDLADLSKGSATASILQSVLGAATDALERARAEMGTALSGAVSDAMALGVELAESTLGKVEAVIPFRFNDELLRNIASYHASLVTDVTDVVRAAITREVQLGILAGTDGRAIVKKLVAHGLEATGPFVTAEGRADAIVRTEVNRVGNIATFDRYTDAATRIATLEKTWNSASDNRVRPSHRALNGVTLPMEGLFDVGGEKAPYPMWPGLSAGESIHCRCRLTTAQKAEAE